MFLMLNAFAQGTKLPVEKVYLLFVECNQPLGMESGKIRDESISATDYHAASSSPQHARLNSKSGAGAWCHPSIGRTTRNEYLQVNLYLI